jgi:hypothetical protein
MNMPYYRSIPYNHQHLQRQNLPVIRHTRVARDRNAGGAGVMQPKMTDVYRMWEISKDPDSYPNWRRFADANGDRVIEVHRPRISTRNRLLTRMLERTNYPRKDESAW